MTSPFEDLILVEVKTKLLNLKNNKQMFEHVHEYRKFYASLNIAGMDASAEEALQKWVARLTLNDPAVEEERSPLTNVFDELVTVRGKQAELMAQYAALVQNIQTSVSPHLTIEQTFSVLEHICELNPEKQKNLIVWSKAPRVLRWHYFDESVKDFQEFLSEENLNSKKASMLINACALVLQDLAQLDRQVVSLQSHFSNVCFQYRKSRSREHFQNEIVQDEIYKFSVLDKITKLLDCETSPDFVQAVHGWGQLYIDGQNEQWLGWSTLLNDLKNLPDNEIPVDLRESAQNLRQIS